jgi:hypothetical protein
VRLVLADILVLLIRLGGKSVSAYGAEVLACILALAEDPFHEVSTRACNAVVELNGEQRWGKGADKRADGSVFTCTQQPCPEGFDALMVAAPNCMSYSSVEQRFSAAAIHIIVSL